MCCNAGAEQAVANPGFSREVLIYQRKGPMRKNSIIMVLVILAGLLPGTVNGFASSPGQRGETGMKNDWTYRKELLLEYGALATVKNDVLLREFRGDTDAVSSSIGHAKTLLVLHQLRRIAGEKTYSLIAGTNEVKDTVKSWDGIRLQIEKELGRDLGWFFKQWVDRKGLPDLRAEHASVRRYGSRFEISFDLVQKGEVYTLDIPVMISFVHGKGRMETVKLDAEKKKVVLFVNEEPSAVVIDPEYDVPRLLTDDETPPFLAKLLSGGKPVLVTAATGTEIYAGAVAAWKEWGAEERQADTIKDSDVKGFSFLVFGEDNPFIGRFYGRVEHESEALTLSAKKNPWNPDKVIVIIQAGTAQAASGALSAVLEHGLCSILSVDGNGRMVQKTLASDNGIVMELREEAAAVRISELRSLSSVIEDVSEKRIVYVGEYHDRFAHHDVELQIIRGLHRKDPRIAIGMEMFQRPFQKTLDEYIGGLFDEREFLHKSEYFKRWGFDYNLYKPILDYAREEKIPVVALNLSREISDKVAKTGMDSLSVDERKDIPGRMDFSDTEYRDRLRQVFGQHDGSSERNFDFFYQAQILWDESMARSIDEYLQKNPHRRMVVIAGLGHLVYGSGIPKRTYRRNGFPYATVLNDVAIERDIADYVVFPTSLEGMTAPKIMAVLKQSDDQISIAELPEGSVSKKAGIKVGDRVVSLDNAPMRSVNDIRIALFYKKPEDVVRIRVKRKQFLLGDREMEFDVTLQ
jgi:aminopeptidase N